MATKPNRPGKNQTQDPSRNINQDAIKQPASEATDTSVVAPGAESGLTRTQDISIPGAGRKVEHRSVVQGAGPEPAPATPGTPSARRRGIASPNRSLAKHAPPRGKHGTGDSPPKKTSKDLQPSAASRETETSSPAEPEGALAAKPGTRIDSGPATSSGRKAGSGLPASDERSETALQPLAVNSSSVSRRATAAAATLPQQAADPSDTVQTSPVTDPDHEKSATEKAAADSRGPQTITERSQITESSEIPAATDSRPSESETPLATPTSPAPAPMREQPVEPTEAPCEPEPVPEFSPEAEPVHVESEASVMESPASLYVVHITPELAPVAKVGGLADVVFGLSGEIERRGNHVEIILPKYASMRYDHIWGLTEAYHDLWVPWYGGTVHCTVFFGFVHGRRCFFIEPHSPDNYFNRHAVYGFHDDVLRFAFFSRAAMEFLWKSGKHPDIVHCHDWQTALVPVYLYEIYQHLGMTHPRVCFTIHNFKHQGLVGDHVLNASGLHRPEHYYQGDRLGDNHNPRALNLMKGGVVYSNFVTTVSPTHAAEAKDHGQGFGLESSLHSHHLKYGGVLNGLDYDAWSPDSDPHIPFHFSAESVDGKYDNKQALRHRLFLADSDKPIAAFVGRLDPQKGLELVRHALFYTLQQGGQFVLLGSSPDEGINRHFWGLKHQLNDSPDCHLEIAYDEELAHLIYAGADMMVVPSRYEPCGLTQMIAMRYGTVPIVREVGGLADTVFDKDYTGRPLHERNGYVFRDYDNAGLESALGRAISCYYDYPEHFRELILNAMRSDYSWKNPGRDYLNIYHYIREK